MLFIIPFNLKKIIQYIEVQNWKEIELIDTEITEHKNDIPIYMDRKIYVNLIYKIHCPNPYIPTVRIINKIFSLLYQCSQE